MNWLWLIPALLVLLVMFSPFMLSGPFLKEEEKRANKEAAKKLPYLEDSQWN